MTSAWLRLIYSRKKQQKVFILLLFFVVTLCIYLQHSFTSSWKYEHSAIGETKRFMPPRYSENKRYIALSYQFQDGQRLGNYLFSYASLLGIAKMNNMTALIPSNFYLSKLFDLTTHVRDSLSITTIHEEYGRRASAFDHTVKKLKGPHDVIIQGYFQSWMYFSGAVNDVRNNLRFKNPSIVAALRFHTRVLQGHPNAVRVGVHVRRTDILEARLNSYGYVAAPKRYFDNAMQYFRDEYENVVFVVCSDDLFWSEEYLSDNDVVFSYDNDAITDLAILSHCDHVIMSVGSFSWWAAWLANGTTIYYNGWPRPHSQLDYMIEKKQYFLPHWIPME